MRDDHLGIGGFFEDLPVLLFVLTGTLLLIGTNVWVMEGRGVLEAVSSCEQQAEDLVGTFMLALSNKCGADATVESVRFVNSSLLDNGSTWPGVWAISVSVIHPWQELLLSLGNQTEPTGADAGWHNRLFNLRYGVSGSAVAEVVAYVGSL
ncbi:MAG: hypothetical protein OEM29_02130 [Thermoplasmata archaeon]|nr:hypothetical protein [Thermoplasmata archaeon]